MENYRTEKVLGTGSTSEVSLVADLRTNIFYALKKFTNTTSSHMEMFNAEVNVLKRLKPVCTQHLLCLVQDFEEDGIMYILTDYIVGYNLYDLRKLEDGRYITLRFAKLFLLQLVPALQTLQDVGIAHRDIKPGNIIYNPITEVFTLVDFGSAVVVAANVGGFSSGYVSKKIFKQFNNKITLNNWFINDVFALGATLFTLLNKKLIYGYIKGDPNGIDIIEKMSRLNYQRPTPWTWNEDTTIIDIVEKNG